MNVKDLSDKLGKCTTFCVQLLFKTFPFQYIFSSCIWDPCRNACVQDHLLLSDFNKNLNVPTDFCKAPHIIFYEIPFTGLTCLRQIRMVKLICGIFNCRCARSVYVCDADTTVLCSVRNLWDHTLASSLVEIGQQSKDKWGIMIVICGSGSRFFSSLKCLHWL